MNNIFIIHGGLKRKSTYIWMANMKLYFERYNNKVHLFYWSGIPTKKEIKKHTEYFIQFYNKNKQAHNFIIAKSLGCDLVNCALNLIEPDKIIFNCPVFLSSERTFLNNKTYVIYLKKDTFIEFWKSIFKLKQMNNKYVHSLEVKNSKTVNHHTMNNNISIKVNDEELFLYDYYLSLLL